MLFRSESHPAAGMLGSGMGLGIADAAIGVRLRSVPFTPARVLAAIQAAR